MGEYFPSFPVSSILIVRIEKRKRMKEFGKRQIDILQSLYKEEIMTSNALANKLRVSSKTIRNEIKEINQSFSTPCILMQKGSGFTLDKDHAVCATLFEEENLELNRNFEVLKVLLSKGKVNFYELADSLYISETTLQKSIHELNEIIAKRNLDIEIKRKNNNLYFDGNEEARRHASTYFLMHEINEYNFDLNNYMHFFKAFDLSSLKQYILLFQQTHQVKMKDFEIISFVMHVAIMIERILQGNEVSVVKGAKPDVEHVNLATQFAQGLHSVIPVSLSEKELLYLSCLFAGKLPVIESQELEEMRSFVEDILQQIQQNYEVNLYEDLEFYNNFLIHLMGLKNRIDNQTFLNNPLMQDIKRHFPLVYDISVFIAMKIQEKYTTSLLEDEIGYITLHLMGALERMHKSSCRKIVILSPLGEAGNGYLRSKLSHIHELQIEICDILSIFDTKKIASYHPDLIVSFVKGIKEDAIPVYTCDGLLQEQDIEKIHLLLNKQGSIDEGQAFFNKDLFFSDLDVNSKEEAIHFLCDSLYTQGYVDKDYEEYVVKREQTAPTAYGNLFAIPHPIEKKANKNMVAVAILRKAVEWNEQKVKLVFLFSLSKKRSDAFDTLFEQLVGLLNDENKVKQLIKMNTFEQFINVFIQ